MTSERSLFFHPRWITRQPPHAQSRTLSKTHILSTPDGDTPRSTCTINQVSQADGHRLLLHLPGLHRRVAALPREAPVVPQVRSIRESERASERHGGGSQVASSFLSPGGGRRARRSPDRPPPHAWHHRATPPHRRTRDESASSMGLPAPMAERPGNHDTLCRTAFFLSSCSSSSSLPVLAGTSRCS